MTLTEAYDVLGLSPDASLAEVKAEYRRRVVRCHPDQGGNPSDFIRLQAAYELICLSRNWTVSDDVPIPDELRILIDRMVADFRNLTDWALQVADQQIVLFTQQTLDHLRFATRSQLRDFGDAFTEAWNGVVNGLFYELNGRCADLTWRYESWFGHANQRSLRADVFRPLLIRDGVVQRTLFEPMRIELFEIERGMDFIGSSLLKAGQAGTFALGATGAIVVDLLTQGIAGPLLGGLAGAALGGVIDRAAHPTEKVRRMLTSDISQIMPVAHQATMAYVDETYRNAAFGLRSYVEQNYKGRVKTAARMLNAANVGGRRTSVRVCPRCGSSQNWQATYCTRCGMPLQGVC
jgi:ribosomal protein L40E